MTLQWATLSVLNDKYFSFYYSLCICCDLRHLAKWLGLWQALFVTISSELTWNHTCFAIFRIPSLILLTVSSIQHIISYPWRALPFLGSKLWAAQNLFQPPDKYKGSPPRSVLLLLEVRLSRCHHLYHKQSDQGSIHPSNHRIQILLPCYVSQSRTRQSSPIKLIPWKEWMSF